MDYLFLSRFAAAKAQLIHDVQLLTEANSEKALKVLFSLLPYFSHLPFSFIAYCASYGSLTDTYVLVACVCVCGGGGTAASTGERNSF